MKSHGFRLDGAIGPGSCQLRLGLAEFRWESENGTPRPGRADWPEFVVNEKKALSDYLLTILKFPEARSHIENHATGTSDSMRNISQKTINSIPVPVLTFDKQRELISRFSQFNEEMVLIQKSGVAMLNDINLLPQKILAQAFGDIQA